MTEQQKREKSYLEKLEAQMKKRLLVLHAEVEELTGLKPVWDPFAQGYTFSDSTGRLRTVSELQRMARRNKKKFNVYTD